MDATIDEAPVEKGEREEMFQRNSAEPGPYSVTVLPNNHLKPEIKPEVHPREFVHIS